MLSEVTKLGQIGLPSQASPRKGAVVGWPWLACPQHQTSLRRGSPEPRRLDGRLPCFPGACLRWRAPWHSQSPVPSLLSLLTEPPRRVVSLSGCSPGAACSAPCEGLGIQIHCAPPLPQGQVGCSAFHSRVKAQPRRPWAGPAFGERGVDSAALRSGVTVVTTSLASHLFIRRDASCE